MQDSYFCAKTGPFYDPRLRLCSTDWLASPDEQERAKSPRLVQTQALVTSRRQELLRLVSGVKPLDLSSCFNH